MPAVIELAKEDDVPRMLAIANEAAKQTAANFATEPETLEVWSESWRSTQEHYPWVVARDEGAGAHVLGFAKASPHRARGAYRWTAEVSAYVEPHHHGRGIGHALYRPLVAALRAQGYVTLLAGIVVPNPASERLHAAHGFTRCGTYRRAGWKFGQWHDVGYWELHLAPEGATPGPLRPVVEVWR